MKKYTNKIETYVTVKPDIVFEVNRQKWTVEVETGVNAEERKGKRIAEKVKAITKEYDKNYFFLVGISKYAYFYEEYGATFTRETLPEFLNRQFS